MRLMSELRIHLFGAAFAPRQSHRPLEALIRAYAAVMVDLEDAQHPVSRVAH